MSPSTIDGVQSNLISNPFVSIKRNPALDKIAAALSKQCYLCRKTTPSSSLIPTESVNLSQIQVFQSYLPRQEWEEDGDVGRHAMKTCGNCDQDLKSVWDLTHQIEAIQQEIDAIVERVTVLRRSHNDTPVKDGSQSEESWTENIAQDSSNTIIVEVKEEIASSEDEVGGIADNHFDELVSVKTEEIFEEEECLVTKTSFNSFPRGLKPKKRRITKDPLAISTDAQESTSELEMKHEISMDIGSKDPLVELTKKKITRMAKDISKTNKLSCFHCGRLLSCRSTLRAHVLSLHLGQRPHKCGHCHKTYVSKRDLTKHIKWIHARQTFPCSVAVRSWHPEEVGLFMKPPFVMCRAGRRPN